MLLRAYLLRAAFEGSGWNRSKSERGRENEKIFRRHTSRASATGCLLNRMVESPSTLLHVTPAGWEFLIDIIPLQLAAKFSAEHHNEDCDAFRFCPYVVEEEGGLVGGHAGR